MTDTLDGPSLGPATGAAPRQLVVLLHGFGSNGADMIALAPLWQRALPEALFIAPNAPERCFGGAWRLSMVGLTSLDRASMAAGVRRAAPRANAFLDALLARYGLSADRLLLVGFSQGTMLALHIGPARAEPLAGIIGYSGMLADPLLAPEAVRSKPPVLLVHGAADPVVPVTGSHEAGQQLRRHGLEIATHVSPGVGHTVDPLGLSLGEKFARRVLIGDPPGGAS